MIIIPNPLQSPDIGQNSYWGITDFQIFCKFLIKENCHNSRICHDIDMKLGPITELEKTTMPTLNLTMTSCRQIVMPLYFFLVYGQLQPSGSRAPNAWSIKLTFSLIVDFFLTKPENRRYFYLQKMLTLVKLRESRY